MTLELAIQKMVSVFGVGSESTKEIALVLQRFGAPSTVTQATLDKVMKAGYALKGMGIK